MNKTTEIILLSSILLVFLIIQLFLSNNNPLLLWDENVYLSNASNYFVDSNFIEDFRFPFLELYLLPLWLLFGISVFSAKLLMILFSIGTLILFYLILSSYVKKFSIRFSLLLFFAFSKLFLYWSFRVYTDIPSLFLFLLSWYFFILSFKKQNDLLYLFFSGISCAFAFFTRFPAAVILSLGLIFIFKLNWKKLFYLSLGFFTIFIPWSIKNIIVYSNPLWDLTSQASIISKYTSWQSPFVLLNFIFLAFGFLLLFLIPSFIILFRKRKQVNYQSLIILSIILFSYYLFFINLKLDRYVLALFPLILILIGLGFDYLLSLKKLFKRKYFSYFRYSLYLIFLFLLFFTLISNIVDFYHEEIYVQTCQKDSALLKSIDYVKENIDSSDLVITNFWPWLGFSNNQHVLSPWSTVPKELLIYDDFGWVLMHNQYGFDWQTIVNQSTCFQSFTGSCGDSVVLCRLDK